jgi:hypothetical protein
MRRLGFLLIIGTLALIWAGGSGVYTALTNTQPTQMTCEEFATGRKSAAWVRLTNCDIDIANIYDRETRLVGTVKEFYVPLRPAGSKAPAPIVISLKDDDLAQKASGAHPTDDKKRFVAGLQVLTGIMTRVNTKDGVDGLVQGDIDHKLLWKAVTENKIATNAVVIELGGEPSMGQSLFMLAVGLGLGWVTVRAVRTRTTSAANAGGAAHAASTFNAPVQPTQPGRPATTPSPKTAGTR